MFFLLEKYKNFIILYTASQISFLRLKLIKLIEVLLYFSHYKQKTAINLTRSLKIIEKLKKSKDKLVSINHVGNFILIINQRYFYT